MPEPRLAPLTPEQYGEEARAVLAPLARPEIGRAHV